MAGLSRAFLGLGSNLRREASLKAGLIYLQRTFGKLTISSIYESAAIGYQGPCYYNLAVGLDTFLDIHTLARRLKQIERALGRSAKSPKFSPRALDIDFLLYDQVLIETPELTLPRPDVLTYEFVLAPLAEIAPDRTHPQLGRRLADLWHDWPEPVTCQRYPLTKIGWFSDPGQ